MKKYYDLEQENREASITIYGDITSWPWLESDVSAYRLSNQIDGLDVDTINVYLNSYGGEVAEGWAIYNALRRHKAQVVTHADGFVCSIASVIFMAGDQRIMEEVSALMIHNPWSRASGNAEELRREAENLDTFADLSAKAYLKYVSISEEVLKEMLAKETWITPEEAVKMGFATEINQNQERETASQSVRKEIFEHLICPEKPHVAPESLDPDKLCDKIAAALIEKAKKAAKKEDGPLDRKPDFLKFFSAL